MLTNFWTRIRSGITGQIMLQAINVLSQVVTVPVCIAAWGTSLYGEWLILASLPMYLTICDFGISSAATREMVIEESLGNHSNVISIYRTSWSMVTIASTCLLLLTFMLLYVVPPDKFFRFSHLDHKATLLIVTALLMHFILCLQCDMFFSAFASIKRYGLGFKIIAAIRFSETTVFCLLVFANYSPVTVASCYLLTRMLGTITFYILQIRINNKLTINLTTFHKHYAKKLIVPSLSTVSLTLSDAINVHGTRLLIGYMLTPAVVTIFTTYKTILKSLSILMTIMNRAVQVEYAMAYAKGDVPFFRTLHRGTTRIAFMLSLTAGLALYFYGLPMVNAWTSGRVTALPALFNGLLMATLFNALWTTSLISQSSINRHARCALLYFTLSIGYISTISFSNPSDPLQLIALANPVLDCIMLFLVLPVSLRYSDDTFVNFVGSMLAPNKLKP